MNKKKSLTLLLIICICVSSILLTSCQNKSDSNLQSNTEQINHINEANSDNSIEPSYQSCTINDETDRVLGPTITTTKHTTLLIPKDYIMDLTSDKSTNNEKIYIHIDENIYQEYKKNSIGTWEIQLTIEEENDNNSKNYSIDKDADIYNIGDYKFYRNKNNDKEIYTTYTTEDNKNMYAVFTCLIIKSEYTENEDPEVSVSREYFQNNPTLKEMFSKFELH